MIDCGAWEAGRFLKIFGKHLSNITNLKATNPIFYNYVVFKIALNPLNL